MLEKEKENEFFINIEMATLEEAYLNIAKHEENLKASNSSIETVEHDQKNKELND